MSWMNELEIRGRYECPCGVVFVVVHPPQTDHAVYSQPHECLECNQLAAYQGFEPVKTLLSGKVSFEQNGIKAYALSSSKGSVTYMSKTKYDYLQTGKIESHYSPEREKALAAAGRSDLLTHDHRKGRGKASEYKGGNQ